MAEHLYENSCEHFLVSLYAKASIICSYTITDHYSCSMINFRKSPN